jgi:hypothetical protein
MYHPRGGSFKGVDQGLPSKMSAMLYVPSKIGRWRPVALAYPHTTLAAMCESWVKFTAPAQILAAISPTQIRAQLRPSFSSKNL